MKGYYNKPDETDMILRRHADGQIWAHTGDVGYMDEDGFVYLDSRIKRMIIRHDGFKVFPSMIENVISRHPAVHQCSVVGCTDKDHVQGRLPFVYVVLDPEGRQKKRQIVRELRQLCKEELPEYVQPVSYKFISEMPMTPRWQGGLPQAGGRDHSPRLLILNIHPIVIFQTLSSPERESFFVWKKPQNTDAAMTAIF